MIICELRFLNIYYIFRDMSFRAKKIFVESSVYQIELETKLF